MRVPSSYTQSIIKANHKINNPIVYLNTFPGVYVVRLLKRPLLDLSFRATLYKNGHNTSFCKRLRLKFKPADARHRRRKQATRYLVRLVSLCDFGFYLAFRPFGGCNKVTRTRCKPPRTTASPLVEESPPPCLQIGTPREEGLRS